jgi:DNA primase
VALRRVAVKLQKEFFPDGANSRTKSVKQPDELITPAKELKVVVNAPLDFELKGLEHNHPYLEKRGFSLKTAVHFGLGYCSRGLLKHRVAIPLHDKEGRLIGYAGRVVDDSMINEDNPRYILPPKRTREGVSYEFRKTLFLYNGFRITAPCDDLIVVEGYTSVWWLTQNGFPWSVAVMGSACSDEQADLIVSLVTPTGRVWLMPDGNKAGEQLALSLFLKVSHRRFVRWVKLEDGLQPTDLPGTKLKEYFTL